MPNRRSLRFALLTCTLLIPLAVIGQKSMPGPVRATLTFENQTDLPLNINWIDYAGVESFNKYGVMGPFETRLAGQAQSGNVYRVRIDDPQCDPLKRVVVLNMLPVLDAPVQTLTISPGMITPDMRQRAKSRSGC